MKNNKKILKFLTTYIKYLQAEQKYLLMLNVSYMPELTTKEREIRINAFKNAENVFGLLALSNGFNLTNVNRGN